MPPVRTSFVAKKSGAGNGDLLLKLLENAEEEINGTGPVHPDGAASLSEAEPTGAPPAPTPTPSVSAAAGSYDSGSQVNSGGGTGVLVLVGGGVGGSGGAGGSGGGGGGGKKKPKEKDTRTRAQKQKDSDDAIANGRKLKCMHPGCQCRLKTTRDMVRHLRRRHNNLPGRSEWQAWNEQLGVWQTAADQTPAPPVAPLP